MSAQAPERTAGPLELAAETARTLTCDCGAWPGCSCDGHGGIHLGRYVFARRTWLLGLPEMTAVLRVAPADGVFTSDTIIGGRP